MSTFLFLVIGALFAEDLTPEQRANLMERLGCASLVVTPAMPAPPAGLPRVTVHPQPGPHFFDAREIQLRVGDGEFLLGWRHGDPLDFVYRTRIRFLEKASAEAREIQIFRDQKTVSAVVRLRPLHRPTARHVINGTNDYTVLVDEEDVANALREHELRVGKIEDVSIYVWHPNGNPPLATEIASVRAAALLQLKGRVSTIKLKVIGLSWGNLVMFEVDIPLPGNEGSRTGSLSKY